MQYHEVLPVKVYTPGLAGKTKNILNSGVSLFRSIFITWHIAYIYLSHTILLVTSVPFIRVVWVTTYQDLLLDRYASNNLIVPYLYLEFQLDLCIVNLLMTVLLSVCSTTRVIEARLDPNKSRARLSFAKSNEDTNRLIKY